MVNTMLISPLNYHHSTEMSSVFASEDIHGLQHGEGEREAGDTTLVGAMSATR